MSAIKRFTAALIALLMLASPAALATSVRYNTREAVRGQFMVSRVYDASANYRQSQSIGIFVNGAQLDAIHVEEEQTVSAGDTLVTYLAPMSDVDIARTEIALSQAQDDYAYEVGRRNQLIAEYRAAAAEAGNETDARIYELQAQREEILLQQYIAGAEAELASLAAQRDAALSSGEPRAISAGIDGTVSYITAADPGAALDYGRQMAAIFTPESLIISVYNPDGALKYGMKVSLRLESSSGQQYLSGTVISADNVLPGTQRTSMAYILPDEMPGSTAIRSVTVTADTMIVENAVLVNNSALQYKDGKCYVRILGQDGSVRVRYVNLAMTGDSESWIILGVEPGDKLITK